MSSFSPTIEAAGTIEAVTCVVGGIAARGCASERMWVIPHTACVLCPNSAVKVLSAVTVEVWECWKLLICTA